MKRMLLFNKSGCLRWMKRERNPQLLRFGI